MPESRETFCSDRHDGRFIDTAGFVHAFTKSHEPALAFDPGMPKSEIEPWQDRLRDKVRELMVFPDIPRQPPPRRIRTEAREGYQLEHWEAFPEPFCVVPYLVLVPDGTSAQSPAPAVMCYPGYSGSKESMAGEPELNERVLNWDQTKRHDNAIGLHLVRNGMIAVTVDNPGCAETSSHLRTLDEVSRSLLWTGRNHMGTSVFQKSHILEWLAQWDLADPLRIATCGLSLGSDPADLVAFLNPDRVVAVVHNDFVCHWRERFIAMNGNPTAIWHIVPGMYNWFDAPDLQAALAPRPLLLPEGGRTQHIDRVRSAYAMQGAADQITVRYYEKYAAPESRHYDDQPIPEGLNQDDYFRYANVDVAQHRFHPETIIPWLNRVLTN